MIKVVRFTTEDRLLAELAFKIRRSVFVEEQNVDPSLEYENEEISNHYLAYHNNEALATARWRETEDGYKLERFATLKEARGKKLASALLNEILDDLRPFEKPVYLNAQVTAISFYEKFGFEKVGEPFYEADIEHYKMIFKE